MQTINKFCTTCGFDVDVVRVCSDCRSTVYCSSSCQKDHWDQHKLVCTTTNKLTGVQIAAIGHRISDEELKKDEFVNNFFDGHEFQLGRGGYGIAYIHPYYDGVLIKKSTIVQRCVDSNYEFKVVRGIQQKLSSSASFAQLSLGKVELVRVHHFVSTIIKNISTCFLIMDHIDKPRDLSIVPKIQAKSHESYHAYLGVSAHHQLIRNRGEYLGRQQVAQLFFPNATEMEQKKGILSLVGDMARFVASVHLIAQYDACDMEYIIGYPRKNWIGGLRIVAIDFDRCSSIAEWNTESIKSAAWSVQSEPYFPSPEDTEYYAAFKTAYLDVARSVAKLELANRILHMIEL